jgi:carbonic anhydrase/acetyltransferase-like protein (isoleucine patch superfamily)
MSYKILTFKGLNPQIDDSAFIADNCVIIGDVKIGKNSSIWFNSVIRGDVCPIRIGSNTNIQDGSVVHTSRFNGPTYIGDNITIGHKAMIHACTVKDFAFIGMSATVLDGAVVEEYGFVAAGAVVTPGKIVKSKELWAGVPAKFIRTLTDNDLFQMQDNCESYVKLAREYMTDKH